MFESTSSCISKYAYFNGVASRSEFWWFSLFYTLMILLGIILDASWGFYNNQQDFFNFEQDLYAPDAFWEVIATLIFFLPQVAVACRRLHDIGKSGWWQLISITIIGYIPLLVWWCTEGESTKKEIHKEIYSSSADELKKWVALRDSGAITDKEYQKKKEELI